MRRRGPWRRLALVAWVLAAFLYGTPVLAQSAQPRFELEGRLEWFGPSQLGGRSATLTPNPPRVMDPFLLFTTTGEQGGAIGGGASVTGRLSRRFSVEGSFLVANPRLEITIPNDVEGLPEIVVEGELTEYLIEASLLADVVTRSRWRVFAIGGAGYLRQLHEGRSLVDEGRVYHAGGGVKYRLRTYTAGLLRGLGIRGQARLLVRDEGFSLEGQNRAAFNLAAGVFAEF